MNDADNAKVAALGYAQPGSIESDTIVEGATIERVLTPPDYLGEITWTVADDGAADVQSYFVYKNPEGEERTQGAGGVPGGTPYVWRANLSSVWLQDPETTQDVEIRTVLTYPDGSVITKSTPFTVYVPPNPPLASSLNLITVPPLYEGNTIEFIAYSDHGKLAAHRRIELGTHRIDVPDGGTQTVPWIGVTGNYSAVFDALFLDGTASTSDPIIVNIPGPPPPPSPAELAAIVDEQVARDLLGPSLGTLYRPNTAITNAFTAARASQNWSLIGWRRADAYRAEQVRWEAIYNNPDTSAQTRAVAFAAADALDSMAFNSTFEGDLLAAGDVDFHNFMVEVNAIVWTQWVAWTQRQATPPTEVLVLHWPGK
ncbi:MAG: hypothetical protein ACR2RB_15990 [Gammaproteobacteria bacterium]